MNIKDSELQEILYQLSKKTGGNSAKLFSFFKLKPESVVRVCPLTRLQYDIYLDICINPDTTTYNIGDYIIYKGSFDLNTWCKALNIYVNAHEFPYRMSLVRSDFIVYQYTRDHYEVTLDKYDLSFQRPAPAELDIFVRRLLDAPYKLFEEPLQKHIVVKLSDDEHLLCIGTHQIAMDGITGLLFFEHMSQIYQALKAGRPAVPAKKPSAFKDYIFINNDTFDSTETTNYWKQLLAGSVLPLRNRYLDRQARASRSVVFGQERFDAVKRFCWQQKITPSFYLKCLFVILLRRMLRVESNFVTFENKHGREKEFLEAPGLFLHSEPMLIPADLFDEHSPIADVVGYFRSFRDKIKAHRNISFRTILDLVENKDGIRCFFNYLKYANVNFLDQEVTIHPFESSAANEIHFFVEEKANDFLVTLFYDESHVEYSHFIERLILISDQIIPQPDIPLSRIDYLLAEERSLLEDKFQGARVPIGKTFPELFLEQVERTPDHIAVCSNGQRMRYSEINSAANALAQKLAGSGIKKNDIVAVLMRRSDTLLISVLAIFKTGAIYLPLDPAYPDGRLRHVLEDARPPMLLMESSNITDLGFFSGSRLETDRFLAGAKPADGNVDTPLSLTDAAYIIYTSGSTGVPKGAVVEHGGMINHLLAKVDLLQHTGNTTVAQTASQGFDISIWQLLMPLLNGGSTVIYSQELMLEPASFVTALRADHVTVLEVVPSYLQVLLQYFEHTDDTFSTALKHVLITGEEVGIKLVRRWFDRFPDLQLINAYGPTEASDDITHYVMKGSPYGNLAPIGYPIQNVKLQIVGESGDPCPIGGRGELWVSGIAVGRGYLNNPELTHRAFGVDANNERLYKTGDYASWQPDGSILFHGRKDHQVKLNGHRVELSEIETLVRHFPGVSGAVVICNAETRSRPVLFYSAKSGIGIADIIQYLKSFLPAAVLPSACIELKVLPLTMNGKTDKLELMKYYRAPEILSTEPASPADNVERQLLEIWEQTLGRTGIGTNDNFFDIGGHSLAAMQIVHGMERKFGQKIPLKTIFEYATIQQLASRLRDKYGVRDADSIASKNETEEFVI